MMKRIRKMALVGVLGIVMSSCASMFLTVTDKAARIQPGMTKDEVMAIMDGAPDYRRFANGRDEWEYRTRIGEDYDVVVLDFRNGRVAQMDSFREVRHYHPSPDGEK